MSAFAAAAAALAADPNLGVDAVYTPPGEGAEPVSLRVVPRQPEAPFGGSDAPRSLARSSDVVVAAASLPARPVRNAGLTFGGADHVVEDVTADTRGVSYTLRLRRAAAA